jgi:hypothetical protein
MKSIRTCGGGEKKTNPALLVEESPFKLVHAASLSRRWRIIALWRN